PLAYNKDNQEDKEPLFDSVDTLLDCLQAYADMVPAILAKRDNMRGVINCTVSIKFEKLLQADSGQIMI
ncbi:MAG: hypothetical protein ACPID7_02750, partial [Candidatus Puniceispirillum sp.]